MPPSASPEPPSSHECSGTLRRILVARFGLQDLTASPFAILSQRPEAALLFWLVRRLPLLGALGHPVIFPGDLEQLLFIRTMPGSCPLSPRVSAAHWRQQLRSRISSSVT